MPSEIEVKLVSFWTHEKRRRTRKGDFDAETESDGSHVSIGGNWDGGGNTNYIRDGNSDIASGDGECCHREEDRPAVCKVSYGSSHAE